MGGKETQVCEILEKDGRRLNKTLVFPVGFFPSLRFALEIHQSSFFQAWNGFTQIHDLKRDVPGNISKHLNLCKTKTSSDTVQTDTSVQKRANWRNAY